MTFESMPVYIITNLLFTTVLFTIKMRNNTKRWEESQGFLISSVAFHALLAAAFALDVTGAIVAVMLIEVLTLAGLALAWLELRKINALNALIMVSLLSTLCAALFVYADM